MTTTSVVSFVSNMEKLSKAIESGADAGTIFHLISMSICDGAGVYYGVKTTVGGATGLTSQCFVAGTIVKTEDGDKPIDDIEEGDMVWSFNPETGEEGLKEVKETFVNETDEIKHISLKSEDDSENKTNERSITIECTPEHPFYVVDYGFKYASELMIGDRTLSQNGNIFIVQEKQKEQLEEPIKVYNFEVEDWHTYCVSEFGVVVHNMCNNKNSKDSTKSIPYSEYDSLSKKSIHNKSSDKVMLGKYDGGGPTSYIKKAGKEYTYFDMGDDWNIIKDTYGFSDEDMFKLFNESFLDDGINAGKTFYFSHNPINDRGALGMEYEYLLKNNYRWDDSTMTMSPK